MIQTTLVICIVFLADFLNNLELIDAVIVAGIHIYIFDVISLFLLLLSFPYWITISRKTKPELFLVGLFWMSIAAFLLGFVDNGLTAGVVYRQDFTVFALLCYLAASRQRVSVHHFTWIIGLYSSLGVLEGLVRTAGIVQQHSFLTKLGVSASSFTAHRLIGSDAALAIAGLSLILFTIAFMGRTTGNRRVLIASAATIALAISVSNMNRSVWLAAISGIVTLFLIMKWRVSFKSRLQLVLMAGSVLAVGTSILWYAQSDYLIQAALEVFEEQSTANWRLKGWLGLIDKVSGIQVLWGTGYGADQTRIIFGQEVRYSAHNLFVHYYFYMGLIGLCLYLAFIYSIFKALREVQAANRSAEFNELATVLTALFVLLFMYHIAYSQWLLDAIVYGYSIRLFRQCCYKGHKIKVRVRHPLLQPIPKEKVIELGIRS